MKTLGLCHRCEHRAAHRETGHAARLECGETYAVHSCYMYEPVKLLVLRRAPGESRRRPVGGGWMVSARMVATDIAKAVMEGKDIPGHVRQFIFWWRPL